MQNWIKSPKCGFDVVPCSLNAKGNKQKLKNKIYKINIYIHIIYLSKKKYKMK